jgi:hypothetical protein
MIDSRNQELAIKRPAAGRWATLESRSQNLPVADDLVAVNVSADAYIGLQHMDTDAFDNEEDTKSRVLDRLRKSELVNLLGRLNGRQAPEPIVVAERKVDDRREVTVDLRLGNIDRRFLILYKAPKNHKQQLNFFVGCTRASRFERVQEQFREAFDGFVAK